MTNNDLLKGANIPTDDRPQDELYFKTRIDKTEPDKVYMVCNGFMGDMDEVIRLMQLGNTIEEAVRGATWTKFTIHSTGREEESPDIGAVKGVMEALNNMNEDQGAGLEPFTATFNSDFDKDKTFDELMKKYKETHPFTPGPKIQLGHALHGPDLECGDPGGGISMKDSVIVPEVVYNFLVQQVNKTTIPRLMELFETDKDLTSLSTYLNRFLSKRTDQCSPLSPLLIEELKEETGINEDSSILEIALFVHYHLSITTNPDQLDYLYR